jgi:nonribosomal peptide synthetase DhbF
VRRWQQFFLVSGCNAPRLINVYGLTETTVANLLCDLSSLSVDGDETPIGLPLLGNLVRIVDENLEPIYDGGVGELFLGGPQLARAYLNRPEINAERFISDSTDGTRWFRTGDAVRRLSTGNLVFLGRLDHQIKLNGFRIEPADIEAALCYHPFIDKACVTCREDIPGTRHLVAYWIPASDSLADIPATELRSFLTETLPEYMIPSMFIRLDVFPLTPNGKIDRNGLPAPLFHAKADDSSTCAPRTLLEHRLLEVWKDVLGRSDFGIHDNFFYLGGDSLTAANITSRIEEVIGQRLSTVALFHAQTIADLATHLQADTNTKPTWQSLIPLQPLGNASPIFVVHGWGGFVWHYLDLALALAPERPVFGLQAIGLDGSTPRHSSINQMAAHYADQIRTLQPKGPYHLLGYSGGGLYAYAVAAELLRHGGSIGMLCMFDSDAVLTYRRIAFLYMIIRLPVHVHKFFRSRPASLKSLIKGRILALQYHLKNLDHQQQGIDIQADQSMNQQGDYFLQLLETYRPPRLPIHIHIFSRPSGMLYKRLLWRFYARKGVVIYPMFNTHEDYYRADLIPELADRLRFVLHQIESRNSK